MTQSRSMEPYVRYLGALRAPDTTATSVGVLTNRAGGLVGSPASPAAHRENTTAPVLVPTLDDMSFGRVTCAELEAWGTLMHSHGDTSRDGLIHNSSGKTGAFRRGDGTRPSSAKIARETDPLFDALERLGPASRGTTVSHSGRLGRATGFVGRTDRVACADPKKCRPSSASAVRSSLCTREIDACRAALAENRESRHRKDGGQQRCSEISVRFLREYALKEQLEDKAFHRALKAEARALEERHMENIHRYTKRSRDLGQSAVYLPHRVGGVLHVLKVHASDKSRFDRGEQGSSGRSLADYGKVMSVDHFMKTEHSRLEKQFHAQQGRNSREQRHKKCLISAEEEDNMGQSRTPHSKRRPNADEARRQIHQLVRDTARLVEVLTAQAVELERQGWNQRGSKGQNPEQ